MIIVEPMLGLCNRMRVIDSVLALNRACRHSVRILWVRDPDLNCRFDDLFVRPAGVDGVFDYAIGTPPGKVLKFLLPRALQNITTRAIHQKEMERLLEQRFDFSALVPLRSVYLRTWDRFYTGEDPLAEFRPVTDLQAMVDSYGLNRQTVGVHIRRTDNQWQQDSPTVDFVRLMEAEIRERPETNFFVATDSPEEEGHLRRLFDGRIVSHPKKSLDRNSREGIRDAVVDVYCLARCGKIIGSHRSSFSEAAAQIGQCPLIIAQGIRRVQPLAIETQRR